MKLRYLLVFMLFLQGVGILHAMQEVLEHDNGYKIVYEPEDAPDDFFIQEVPGVDDSGLLDDQSKWCLLLPGLGSSKSHDLPASMNNFRAAYQQLKEEFENERVETYLLARRDSPDFEVEVEQSLKSNFLKTPGIDYRRIYEFIGLDPAKAFFMSHSFILNLLDERYKAGTIEPGYYRQLRYSFGHRIAKEEYDAFLTGRLSELRSINKKHQQERLEKLNVLADAGIQLSETDRPVAEALSVLEKIVTLKR